MEVTESITVTTTTASIETTTKTRTTLIGWRRAGGGHRTEPTVTTTTASIETTTKTTTTIIGWRRAGGGHRVHGYNNNCINSNNNNSFYRLAEGRWRSQSPRLQQQQQQQQQHQLQLLKKVYNDRYEKEVEYCVIPKIHENKLHDLVEGGSWNLRDVKL